MPRLCRLLQGGGEVTASTTELLAHEAIEALRRGDFYEDHDRAVEHLAALREVVAQQRAHELMLAAVVRSVGGMARVDKRAFAEVQLGTIHRWDDQETGEVVFKVTVPPESERAPGLGPGASS
jgi:hypothetical protein